MYHPSRVWTVAKPVRYVSKPQVRNPKPVKGAVHFTRTQDMRLSPIAGFLQAGLKPASTWTQGAQNPPRMGARGLKVPTETGCRLAGQVSDLTLTFLFPTCNVSYT